MGIVPTEVPVLPSPGFDVFDAGLVTVETLTGEETLSEPDDVAHHVKFFDQLRDAALTGADAVALIGRAAAVLRP